MTRRFSIRRSLGRAVRWAALGFAAAVLSEDEVWAQCSLCRDAVASSSSEVREAMNYAIIGLAFAPYGVGVLAALAASPGLRIRIRERINAFVRSRSEEQL